MHRLGKGWRTIVDAIMSRLTGTGPAVAPMATGTCPSQSSEECDRPPEPVIPTYPMLLG